MSKPLIKDSVYLPPGDIHMKRSGKLVGNLNEAPKRDQSGRGSSFIRLIKDTTENGTGLITSPVQESNPHYTGFKRPAEIEPEKGIKSVFCCCYYYFFACTLNDTLTAKIGAFRDKHPKYM